MCTALVNSIKALAAVWPDRMCVQVLGIMSVSAEMLRVCIPLIFEKAVAEPTFCVLYADLCAVLTRELDAVRLPCHWACSCLLAADRAAALRSCVA